MKKIIVIPIILIIFVFVVLLNSCKKKSQTPEWRYNGPMPVTQAQYEADTAYFAECFLANVEYYRLHCRNDIENKHTQDYKDSCAKYPDAQSDPAGCFIGYSRSYSEDLTKMVNYSLSTYAGQFEVLVDTILYSKDARFLFIFYAVYVNDINYKEFDGLFRYRDYPYYNADIMIGCRENLDERLKFYPIEILHVSGYPEYRKAMDYLENNVLLYMSDLWPGEAYPDSIKIYGAGPNDPDFFEKAACFKKYDDTTYYFQFEFWTKKNIEYWKHKDRRMCRRYNYHFGN